MLPYRFLHAHPSFEEQWPTRCYLGVHAAISCECSMSYCAFPSTTPSEMSELLMRSSWPGSIKEMTPIVASLDYAILNERICPYCDVKNHPRWTCNHIDKYRAQNERRTCTLTLCVGNHPPFLCPLARCNNGVGKPNWAQAEKKAAKDDSRVMIYLFVVYALPLAWIWPTLTCSRPRKTHFKFNAQSSVSRHRQWCRVWESLHREPCYQVQT